MVVRHAQLDTGYPSSATQELMMTGYVLGLVIEATIQHQTPSNHPDPIHVTGHFLKSTVVGPFEVHIRILKTGRSFTNVSAQLVQHVRYISYSSTFRLYRSDTSPRTNAE